MRRGNAIALVVVLLAACGYTIGFRAIAGHPEVQAIAVPVFENSTSEPEATAIFTASFRREVSRRGFRVVESGAAHAVLIGNVRAIEVRPVAFPVVGGALRVGEYQLKAVVEITLKDSEGKVLWKRSSLSDVEEFLSGTYALATESKRRLALTAAAESLARRSMSLMCAGK